LLRNFELDRSLCLLLHKRRSRNYVASYADVLHLQARQIARLKLAVDRQVEHRQLTSVGRDLQPRSNRPDFSKLQRRLLAGRPPLVPRHPARAKRIKRFHDSLLFNEGRSILRVMEWSIFDPLQSFN